jgi:hypothetical protein
MVRDLGSFRGQQLESRFLGLAAFGLLSAKLPHPLARS